MMSSLSQLSSPGAMTRSILESLNGPTGLPLPSTAPLPAIQPAGNHTHQTARHTTPLLPLLGPGLTLSLLFLLVLC